MAVEPRYRLTHAARDDLDELWNHSVNQWSVERADRYLDELFDLCELIAQHPSMATEYREFVPPVRIHPHRSHLIVYRAEHETLVILRVLHVRRDWRAVIERDEI